MNLFPGRIATSASYAIHQRAHEGLARDEIDRLVAVRMTRQAALDRATAPLKFAAIINESVLYRQVGGTAVMRAQIEHMIEMATHPAVRVQVVPFKAGAHAGMNGAFPLLRFEDAQPIIYLENLAGASVTRRRADVALYEEAFTDLQILAVGPQDSLGMIRKAIKEY